MDCMNGMDGIDRKKGRGRMDYMDGISRMDMIEGNEYDGWYG